MAKCHSENGRPGPRGHTARVAVAVATAAATPLQCAPAPQRIAARFETCPRYAAPSAARQRCTRLRTIAQRLRTPSFRHGYRHSNTTCVQGCARTPPCPARCCPGALTTPVRANGRLPRALAPLPARRPGRNLLFFFVVIFSTRGRIAPQPPRRRAEFGFGRGARRGGAGGAHRNAPARTPDSPDGRAPRSGICHVSVQRIP